MNDLCADIGYKSINHVGEQLCGDHVEVVEVDDNSTIIVLSDGLGSGVKASILSTLTSKIISTMMAAGLPLEECVSAIAATLPVCSLRGVAYSTFTIIHIKNNEAVEIIQYDNPQVIVLRDNKKIIIVDPKRVEHFKYKDRVFLSNRRIYIGEEHIEEIIDKMEAADVSLDASFELYKNGLEEIKAANALLDDMEKAMLVLNEDGSLEEF